MVQKFMRMIMQLLLSFDLLVGSVEERLERFVDVKVNGFTVGRKIKAKINSIPTAGASSGKKR